MSEWLSSIGPAVANHLWQSTAFAAGAWGVTLLLKKNQARVRYGVWLVASVKFLLPFSLLIGLGGMLPRPQRPVVTMPAYSAVDQVALPFDELPAISLAETHVSETRHGAPGVAVALAAVWLCGVVVVLMVWAGRWRAVTKSLRRAQHAEDGREVNILRRLEAELGWRRRVGLLLSSELMEPGMFGIWRPKLIWPEQLSAKLDDAHIEAILAHELMHVRRRDNLNAALHMVVEAAFWFHPMVWWMERRMVEERELACDEAAVAMGNRPRVYAESLLKACRFCVESPLTCVAGITGADLTKRIRSIMTLRVEGLGLAMKAGLAVLGLAAIMGPVGFGVVRMIPVYGQVLKATGPLPSYEVVVIKPSQDPAQGATTQGEQTHYLMTAKMLVQFAYGVFSPPKVMNLEVLGGPDWINTDVFAILGKMGSTEFEQELNLSRAAKHERRQLMEQSLLADRFKLKMHTEMRDQPVYALTVMKGGLKMTPSKDGTGSSHFNPSPGSMTPEALTRGLIVQAKGRNFVMTAKGVTLDNLVDALMVQKETHGRPVVNQTVVTGAYNFTLTWGPDDTTASDSGDVEEPPLFTAIQQQLGLKLADAKGPGEVVVIDHIEKPVFDEADSMTGAKLVRASFSQTKASPTEFEVASVKPNVSGCCTSSRGTADQMMLTNQTLKNLIVLAYAVQPYQVTGPAWMENERFDITAKYPPGTKFDDRWPMLRKLLEDRFKLTVRRDTKEMSGYALAVDKGGFKLKPSDPGEGSTTGGSQGNVWTMQARKVEMSTLAWELADSLGEVVVDKTGLDGVYDFRLRWSTNNANSQGTADPNPPPSVFTAVQETLGLRLQHGKVDVPVIVVDHVEHTPTEN